MASVEDATMSVATAAQPPSRRTKRTAGILAAVVSLGLLCGGAIAYNHHQARVFADYARALSPDSKEVFAAIQGDEAGEAFLNDPVFESAEWFTYAAVIDGDEINVQAFADRDLAQLGSAIWLPWLQDDVIDEIYTRKDQFRPTPASAPMAGSPASIPPVAFVFAQAQRACDAGDVDAFMRENPLATSMLVGALPVDRARSQEAADAVAPLLMSAAVHHVCGSN